MLDYLKTVIEYLLTSITRYSLALCLATLGVIGLGFGLSLLKSQYTESSEETSLKNSLGCEEKDYDRGPLIIKSGSTVTLAAGQSYVYSSILIHKGATLQFIGDTVKEFTVLRSRGDFILEGTIRSQGFNLDSLKKSQYCQVIKLDTLRHVYRDLNKGGKGGAGGRVNECNPQTTFQLACVAGKPGVSGCGGEGGTGMTQPQIVECNSGKGGKNCYLITEFDSDVPNATGCDPCDPKNIDNGGRISPGRGGAGGSNGKFGGLLYLISCENFIGERGLIDVSGSTGGSGKPGVSNRYTGGGGGGGGPGGSGGAVYFNIRGNLSLPTIKVNGGEGGKGGIGGKPHPNDGLTAYVGSNGEQGETGSIGQVVIINEIKQYVSVKEK